MHRFSYDKDDRRKRHLHIWRQYALEIAHLAFQLVYHVERAAVGWLRTMSSTVPLRRPLQIVLPAQRPTPRAQISHATGALLPRRQIFDFLDAIDRPSTSVNRRVLSSCSPADATRLLLIQCFNNLR